MAHGKEVLDELRPESRELRRLIPDAYAGFASLHRAALAAGAVDARTKELVALAISVATECDGCIASHASGAARAGATREQVAEVIGVALLMAGGPASIYGPRALAAFDEFSGVASSA